MPTVRLNDMDVYFERSGDGPRLLYLNGSGTTLATAAMVLAPFREVFELAAHDQRGLGSTSIPDRPATMSDYAADAVAL
ncbi:MAG: alpha/beta hydrolase, partial [Acidimicrobiales bacterium]